MKIELWQALLGALTFCMPLLLAVRKLVIARIELARVRTESAIKIASAEGVAVAEMRATKLTLSGIHVTPVAKLAMARDAQLAKLAANPAIDEKKISDTALVTAIESSHASVKEAVRQSDPPLGPGDSGEHAINIPANTMPELARPSGAPSGLDMDVDRDADTLPIKPVKP